MAPLLRRTWVRWLLAAVVVLAALVTVGLLVLDRVLTSKAREATAELSRKWGRPVELEAVATRLVPFGVKVTGVRIGAAPGEPKPLLELPRAEVRVGLLRAIGSLGKDVVVKSAEVDGLRVNVLRFPDGTTNAERLAKQAQGEQPQRPAEPGRPRDLSYLRVDEAAVSNARIAFLDLARPGAKELAVDDLDVTVRDLRAGRPLDVLLRAAVLAERQNLELRVHAAPLPPSLQPTPDRVVLKVQPIDLDPLAPFLPAAVGFLGGRLQADLDAALGAAVPGGAGPTHVKGGFTASALRFKGQEGGKPLDVVLDADVDGDADRGDVRIGKLRFTAGPAALTGAGGATGLKGSAPKLEGLRVVASGLDPQLLAAYYPPLRRALGDKAAGPVGFELRAAGDASSPALEARLDLTPVRLAFPDALAKAAGAPLVATARVGLAGDTAHVTAHADLAGLDLRPGGSLAKAPGDRLAIDADVTRRASKDAQAFDVKRLDVQLPADAVAARGTATIAGEGRARTIRFDLAAESARLDLDRLLLPGPAREKKKGEPLSPDAFAGLSGTVRARVGEVRYHKASFRDVVARLKLVGDDLQVEQARLSGLGGQVSADGTRVRLAHPQEPAQVKVKLDRVDAGEALAMYTPRKLLTGRVSANVDLAAGATSGREVLESLAGQITGNLFDGQFLGKDLLAGVMGPLAKALPFGAAKGLSEGGATPLGKDLPFAVRLANGAAHLEKPMRVETSRGAISTEGGQVKLDGTLDMPVTVALSPDAISALTGGRARPGEPVPVALRLTGPAWDPHLSDLALQPAVASIVKSAGGAALGKMLGIDSGKPAAPSGTGGPAPAPKDAADAAKKKAEDALRGLLGR